MDALSARLNRVHCVNVDNCWLPRSASFCTNETWVSVPKLSNTLCQIGSATRVIKAAEQFGQPDPRIPEEVEGEIVPGSQRVGEKGCMLFDQFDEYIRRDTLKTCPKEVVASCVEKARELAEEYNNELTPVAQEANRQIQRSFDNLNVTDRLLGYRNNLTRNGAFKHNQKLVDELPQDRTIRMAPRFNLDEDQERCCLRDRMKSAPVNPRKRELWPATVQERAGLIMKFPGESETRAKYTAPPRPVTEVLNNHGGLRLCQPGYKINPQPEFEKHGWHVPKLNHRVELEVSEFTHRFVWPDRKLVHTTPWNRSTGQAR